MDLWKLSISIAILENISYVTKTSRNDFKYTKFALFYNFLICPIQLYVLVTLSNNSAFNRLYVKMEAYDFGDVSKVTVYFLTFHVFATNISIFIIFLHNFVKRVEVLSILKKLNSFCKMFHKNNCRLKIKIITQIFIAFLLIFLIRLVVWIHHFHLRIESFIFCFFANPLENVVISILVLSNCFLKFLEFSYENIIETLEKNALKYESVEIDKVYLQMKGLHDISKKFFKIFRVQMALSFFDVTYEVVGRVSFTLMFRLLISIFNILFISSCISISH